MKARVPKAYQDLSEKQKKQIADFAADVAFKAAKQQNEHDCRLILDIYMKMVCIVLHDAFGFGENRLTCFIGNHKRLFIQQSKLVSKGEQLDYLNKRLAKIFKKSGFPQKFIDDLLGEVVLADEDKEE